MSETIIIAAVAANNVIGKEGKIPWHISEDFKHFKTLTAGHPVIMGRKTFESLPIRPLPKRTNIVLTRGDYSHEGVIVKHSMEEALEYCRTNFPDDAAYIIGGQKVYEMGMAVADRLELTHIEKEYEGDTFFPQFDDNQWKLTNKEQREGFSFCTYERIR